MKKVNESLAGKLRGTLKPNGQVPPAPPQAVQLTSENAAIFSAKFLEGILIELRKLNALLEKSSG